MKKLNYLVLICLALLFNQEAKATHIMGSEITYRQVGTNPGNYEVTLILYRDCSGIAMNKTQRLRLAAPGYSGFYTMNMNFKSVEDITPVCKAYDSKCDTSTGTGRNKSVYGVEKYTFKDTVYLYGIGQVTQWQAQGACEIRFEWTQCCRNSAITTGGKNRNFLTYASIDLCNISTWVLNSSPVFENTTIHYIQANTPFSYNFGAYDPDGDSLVYELVNPLEGSATDLPYSTGFSATKPFTVYCNGGGQACAPNPTASTPEGFFFNKDNGDIVFTPTNFGEVSVYCIQVYDYRKINGKMVLLGSVRRDIQVAVINTASNLQHPIFDFPCEIAVCRFDTTCVEGYAYIRDSWPSQPDTLDVSLVSELIQQSGAYVNATFTRMSPYKTKIKLCVSPPTSMSTGDDYTTSINFLATRNTCPLQLRSYKNVTLHFNTLPLFRKPRKIVKSLNGSSGADVNVKTKGCIYAWSDTNSNYFRNFKDTGTYLVTISNGCGSVTDTFCIVPSICKAQYVLGVDTSKPNTFYAINTVQHTSSTIYTWSFGDGQGSNQRHPTHYYNTAGTFQLCLTIQDTVSGCTDTYCDSVTYAKPNGRLNVIPNVLASVASIKTSDVKLYPNPAKSVISIELPKAGGKKVAKLYSIQGKLLNEFRLDDYRTELDISKIQEGVYLLHISIGDQILTKRFIKTL